MIALIASAGLLVLGSLTVGQAVLSLCGRRRPTALAGPVGLALLLVVAGLVAGWGGRGGAIAISVAALALAAVAVLAIRGELAVPAPGAPAAALLAGLAASIPFIAAGGVGILGVGLVNDDMASHLLLADWIGERFRPEPVLIDQGYPLGPHALVAGVGWLLGASSIEIFAGLTLALPALMALVAYAALEGLRAPVRVAAAALVALPYMAAAYLAQEAFKEPMVALFVLAFALLLAVARDWRDGVTLGLLAAGTVYVYSFPGLAWLAGTALVWGAIALVRERRLGGWWLGLAVAVAVLAVLVAPDLDRVRDFADFRALDPDRANEGGLGNLPGQLSPFEALGIWPTSEFRLSASAAELPALVFYAGGLFALTALCLAAPRWVRRHGLAVPAALSSAAVLYLIARGLGTVYTSAKALAIAAPLIALITLGGLLATRLVRGGPSLEPPTGIYVVTTQNPVGRQRRWPIVLGTLFAIAAAFSSFLILRQAPVAPSDHADELAQIRPLVEGEKLLFLGRDNFVLYELRGSKPFTHVRNFYDPYFVEPNFELADVGAKFDFDSVTATTLERFRYVLTTRAAYASGPPPGYRPVAETASYTLWERGGRVTGRRPGEDDAAPGRIAGCDGEPAETVAFAREPVVAEGWSESTVRSGEVSTITLELPAGSWELSLQYDSTTPLTLSAPGFEHTLPGNLDYRGTAPFWAAGTIEVDEAEPVEAEATVDDPPFAGRLFGARSVAHLGALAATRGGAPVRGLPRLRRLVRALMEVGFGEALLVIGTLLAVSAALSGLMRGTVLSASVLSVVLGIVLAELEVISVDVGDQGVLELIELALILTLVSDGLVVDRELLGRHWGPPARALVFAMPLTLCLLAVGAKLLFGDLAWAEAFLLAAVLTPTDPVVTSTVVTAQRVPETIRHTLNLESGLNDGLALPFVLFFLVLATPGGDAGTEAAQLLGEAGFGVVEGIALGVLGGWLHRIVPGGVTRALRRHLRDRLRARGLRARRRHLR